jgi:hypothetical protein
VATRSEFSIPKSGKYASTPKAWFTATNDVSRGLFHPRFSTSGAEDGEAPEDEKGGRVTVRGDQIRVLDSEER